jgi:hypothetical protein
MPCRAPRRINAEQTIMTHNSLIREENKDQSPFKHPLETATGTGTEPGGLSGFNLPFELPSPLSTSARNVSWPK